MQPSLRFLAALTAAAPSFAATTTSTDSASFLAALAPGAYTNAFTAATFSSAASYSFSGGGFGYTVAASPGQTYLSGTFIGNFTANQVLTVTFTAGAPTAVGGEFFITDSLDNFVSAPVTVTLSDGTTTTFTPTSEANGFRGFTSTAAITSLTMAIPGAGNFNTIDNLVVGNVAAVPEAGTWLMMGLGLAGLAFMRRQHAR